MIRKLPFWCLTDKNPAFYDTDSKTAVEQTAKLYGKMQELIDYVNEFVKEVNSEIDTFTSTNNKNYEEFTTNIQKIIHDFIECVDTKIASQNKEIQDAIEYMKDNLALAIENEMASLFESGELTINYEYDPETESLNITGITKGGNE